jgi:hypothetical protein
VAVGGGLRGPKWYGPKPPLEASAITCLYGVQFKINAWKHKLGVNPNHKRSVTRRSKELADCDQSITREKRTINYPLKWKHGGSGQGDKKMSAQSTAEGNFSTS